MSKPIWDHTLRLTGPKGAFEAALLDVEERLGIERERAFDDVPEISEEGQETIIFGLHIDSESILDSDLIRAHPDVVFSHLAWDADQMLLLKVFGGEFDGIYPLTRQAFAQITLRLSPILAYQLPLPPADYREVLELLSKTGMLFGARMGYSLTVEMSDLEEALEADRATIQTTISRDRSALPWAYITLDGDRAEIHDSWTEEKLLSLSRSDLQELFDEGDSILIETNFAGRPGQVWLGAV